LKIRYNFLSVSKGDCMTEECHQNENKNLGGFDVVKMVRTFHDSRRYFTISNAHLPCAGFGRDWEKDYRGILPSRSGKLGLLTLASCRSAARPKIGHEYLRISIPANSPAKPQSQEHFFVLKVLAHESLLEPEKPKRSGLEDFSSFVSVSVNWRVAFFRI
jgi:hypothetical protein